MTKFLQIIAVVVFALAASAAVFGFFLVAGSRGAESDANLSITGDAIITMLLSGVVYLLSEILLLLRARQAVDRGAQLPPPRP